MFCPWVRSAPKKLDATVDMAYLIGVCTDHRHGLPGRPRSSAEFPLRAARARSLSGHDVMFGYPAVETDGCTSLITLRRSRHDGLIGAYGATVDGESGPFRLAASEQHIGSLGRESEHLHTHLVDAGGPRTETPRGVEVRAYVQLSPDTARVKFLVLPSSTLQLCAWTRKAEVMYSA